MSSRVHGQARLSRTSESNPQKPDTNICCSDPFVSSQSTQLLQHALAPTPQGPEQDWDPASPNDGNTAIDFSLDSRIIPAQPVTPRYHLQVSLLQSPEGSGEGALAEDSHKEKLRQENGEVAGISGASSNNVPVQLGSGSEPFHQHGVSPVTASAGKVIGEPPLNHVPLLSDNYLLVSSDTGRILSVSLNHHWCSFSLSTNKIYARREQTLPPFSFPSLPGLVRWSRLAGSGRTVSRVSKAVQCATL